VTAWPRVAALALAYSLTHHVGAADLGTVGDVTVATLVDLLTPWLVLGTAALALVAVGTDRTGWWLAGAGALAYASGHGIHLAANSISDETEAAGGAPSGATHLWDEVVGHWLWYAGFALLAAALVRRLAQEDRPSAPLPVLLALGVGTTWATNGLEGGTAVGSLAAALLAAVVGARHRRTAGLLLLVAALPAVALLAGWGVVHGGWPQPSSL
jgi:hypothetical protein